MLIYDENKLQELLSDFYNLTSIKICLFDDNLNELFYYPKRLSGFCELVQSSKEGHKRCKNCDEKALNMCKKMRSTYIYKCHMQLSEAITPLFYDNVIVGYIMVGQVVESNLQNAEETITKMACECGIDKESSLCEYRKIVRIKEDKLMSACHIVEACASYLHMKKQIGVLEDSLITKLNNYIDENIKENLSVDRLCGKFFVCRTELYSIFSHYYGMTVAEYIKSKRIAIAKDLLITTQKTIKKVAQECGIADYNYFSKVFKKTTSLSPKQYRKANCKT